jgi:hypothetical protein
MVVDVHRNLDTGTVLTNSARVRVFDTPAYSAAVQIATTVVSTPSLSLSIGNGTTAVEAGDDLVYTVNYFNTGSGRAYGVVITATPPLPQLVEAVDCRPSGICSVVGGEVLFDVGTVAGGAGGNVRLLVSVRDPLAAGSRSIAASAVIDTITPGDEPDGNSAQDVDTIATRPDLQIQAQYHAHTPYPGKYLSYTVRYSNTGHIATTGVVIAVEQPDFTTYDPVGSSAWQRVGDGRYTYNVGALDYNQGGTLIFAVTLPTGTFTTAMPNFDADFSINDDGGSGADGNPGNNIDPAPLGVPDIIVEDVEVNWTTLFSGQPGRHITVTLKNQGTNIACNPGPTADPDFCGLFYIDLYINPVEVPPSLPTGPPFGEGVFDLAGPLHPGESHAYPILGADFGPFKLPPGFTPPLVLYARVDNFSAAWPFGLVPEYNELNNVFGPVMRGPWVYLPLMMRGR